MIYRYSVDLAALQFTGDNHSELKTFVSESASIDFVSYWQSGPNNPVVLTGPDGFNLSVPVGHWVLCLDGGLTIASHEWFQSNCYPLEER